jgi:hypothetical protein
MYTSGLSLWASAEQEGGYLLPTQPMEIIKVGNIFSFIMTGNVFEIISYVSVLQILLDALIQTSQCNSIHINTRLHAGHITTHGFNPAI